jgi:hypothetical protein
MGKFLTRGSLKDIKDPNCSLVEDADIGVPMGLKHPILFLVIQLVSDVLWQYDTRFGDLD